MNGKGSESPTYIFASVAQWLRHWLVMAEVVGSSPVIFKDFPQFLI